MGAKTLSGNDLRPMLWFLDGGELMWSWLRFRSPEKDLSFVSRGGDGGEITWGISSSIQDSQVFIEPSPALFRITEVATSNTGKSAGRTNHGTRTEDGKAFWFRVSRTPIPGRDLASNQKHPQRPLQGPMNYPTSWELWYFCFSSYFSRTVLSSG